MMIRLCSRKLIDMTQLRTLSTLTARSVNRSIQPVGQIHARVFSGEVANPQEYACVNPDNLLMEYMWADVEDWDMDWFDGRDTLHIRVEATTEGTVFRGISYYSKEGYWMGALRWSERLRGEKPAVWLHWVGKDPIEMATKLPRPDANGCYTFTTRFNKREFVLHCNGELLGVRKNMLYQFNNVGKVWFADLEEVKGKYMIEGGYTHDSGYTTYNEVPMFKRFSEMWQRYRSLQVEYADQQYPDQGWRSEK